MTRALSLAGLSFLLGLSAACSSPSETATATPDEAASKIYRGGPIVTVDEDMPSAEALAVRSGRIVAVGTEAEVMVLRGEDTEIIELEGRTLAPGFIDGHAHVMNFGAQAVGAKLLAPPDGAVETIDDLVAELSSFAEGPDLDRTGWIFGLGYDDSILAERRHPDRDELDRVSTELPVMAIHISGHFCSVNSVGLEMLGISSSSEDPEGGIIRRRPNSREPNGVLEELAAIPNMIAVLMRDAYRLNALQCGTGFVQSPGRLATTQTGINEDPRFIRRHVDAIPGTPTRQPHSAQRRGSERLHRRRDRYRGRSDA